MPRGHELIHVVFILHADHLSVQLSEEEEHSRYLIQLCYLPIVCFEQITYLL